MIEYELSRMGISEQQQVGITGTIKAMIKGIKKTLKLINDIDDVRSRLASGETIIGGKPIKEGAGLHREISVSVGSIAIEACIIQNINTGRVRLYKYGTVWIGDNCIEDVALSKI